ncbi:insulin-like growth factor-binding protein-related protein 1 [Aplysia californica]|uniref:Insulin-like growth factor-binding protein-related protein 1 n=1 Tax=Aplysia californica TaxID=6500 RepID=A0ABM0JNA1_APLCA|nr:insulin-like growth factor-binding protein-related protein 1 [Aplysia californica]
MKVLLVALSVALVVVYADKCEEQCAQCPVLERSDCLAGVDKDPDCQCCDVCSRFEGQKCDMKDEKPKHGSCGDGLECKKARGGNICQCMWEEIICGTNGVTYSNLCQLMATAVRESKQDELEVKSVGPCEPGAKIITKPEYIKNTTNNNIVLSCEAIGFPVPTISWNVTRANSKTFTLPGDDSHIVTAMRGGPAKYQVTSWMQIEGLMKRHEGDYTCIAVNEHGVESAKARIKVVN